jgi:hypothetical protein
VKVGLSARNFRKEAPFNREANATMKREEAFEPVTGNPQQQRNSK